MMVIFFVLPISMINKDMTGIGRKTIYKRRYLITKYCLYCADFDLSIDIYCIFLVQTDFIKEEL